MYRALAPLVGALITLMNSLNSRFSAQVGGLVAALSIHIAGLIAVTLLCVLKKEKAEPGKPPVYCYLGGFFGVGTVFGSNYAFGALGASLAVALALLGQTFFSLAVDATGFMGKRKYPLTARRLPSVVLTVAGAALMAGNWRTDAPAILVALLSGVCTGLSFVFNSELGRKRGVLRSARTNYLVGLATSALIAAATLPTAAAVKLAAGSVAAAGPILALGGGLMGVVVVVSMNFIFPRIPAFAATLLVFGGQALTGLFIDLIAEGRFDARKLAGTLLVLAGLGLDSLFSRKKRV
jgi:bacterial/archaeal transporter family-2 protein